LVIAGVWQDWADPSGAQGVRSCALVTCGANAAMAQLHHRMPVILEPQDWPLWLGEAGHGAAPLMAGAPAETLEWHRVARDVNSNRASGADLIAPLA